VVEEEVKEGHKMNLIEESKYLSKIEEELKIVESNNNQNQ
jgi:hypothetical protein